MKMVALIPARAGSKRIPGKNTKLLAGRHLLAWTIYAAVESGVFSEVYVSSEDDVTLGLAAYWGAKPLWRAPEWATDDAPDIGWVRAALVSLECDAFAILRPTSPFRTAETIRRAYAQFQTSETHSLRAVQPAKEHPGKMWLLEGAGYPMTPLWNQAKADDTPFHSRPTQTLPQVYVQNASLEMAWTYVVKSLGTISGRKVAPFFTHDYEGFDLNTMDDWREAERLIKEGLVELPSLPLARI